MLTRRELRERRLLSAGAHDVETVEATVAVPPAAEPAAPARSAGTVSILIVCTGNVIRSALAERALRQQFSLLGAARFDISSAGTRAAVGQGMWRESVEIASAYGFDHRDFVARQLDDAVLDGVDYVLAAAREHRESVLRRRPDLLHRTFTFRELVRILDESEPGAWPTGDGEPADRWIDLAAWADERRRSHLAAVPEDDDLADPRDGGREQLWTFERDLIRGVVTLVSAVSGEFR